jgi:hypothetical protein
MFLLKSMITHIKNLHVPQQFDFESILHQTSPMAILGNKNSMGVLQNDELFDKMNTKRNWNFKIIPYCYNCDFFYSHIIIQNKMILEFGKHSNQYIISIFKNQIDVNNPKMEYAHKSLPIASYLLTRAILHQIEMREYNSSRFLIQVCNWSISHKG